MGLIAPRAALLHEKSSFPAELNVVANPLRASFVEEHG